MDATAARNASPIVAEIDARNTMVTQLNAAVTGNYLVTSMKMLDPATNLSYDVILGQLDGPTSIQCFQFALSIYNAQLTALDAQLAAL